ncbi:MAG: hypothetical protein KIS92_16870 [Planctomycetota bacterium]|nr:hypothetical protein [Planctomycetota bacterium]
MRALRTWAEKPLFSYATILLLQAKVVWDILKYKDLTLGDTSKYYFYAKHWHESLQVNPAWSPLYTAYYGSFRFFLDDAHTITILHRVAIVFALTALVLAILRRLLPWELAWFVAAWWAVLPINFNALYEVHLFALLPVLAAWYVCLRVPTLRGSGIAAGILAAAGLLVRNELAVCAGLYLPVSLALEGLRARRARRQAAAGETPQAAGEVPPTLGRTLAAYGLPLGAALALCALAFSRSYLSPEELRGEAYRKLYSNMGQSYAYGYQQRHPEWTRSPWTEYHPLMAEQFGRGKVTMLQALRANPGAMLEQFSWNARLVPSGVQVMLFNATSGELTPDYVPVEQDALFARVCSCLWLAVLAAGAYGLYRQWGTFWKAEFARAWRGWVLILCVIPIFVFLVIPAQRPRPSYLFPVAVFLMAATGLCLWAFARVALARLSVLRSVLPLGILAVLLLTPRYYRDRAHRSSMKLDTLYRRLRPFQALLTDRRTLFMGGFHGQQARRYLESSDPGGYSYGLLKDVPAGVALTDYFDAQGLTLAYLDESYLPDFAAWTEPGPGGLPRLRHQGASWKVLAAGNEPKRWVLAYRPSAYAP